MKIKCQNCSTVFEVLAYLGRKDRVIKGDKKVVVKCNICIDDASLWPVKVPDTEEEKRTLRKMALSRELWPAAPQKCALYIEKKKVNPDVNSDSVSLRCGDCKYRNNIDKSFCDKATEYLKIILGEGNTSSGFDDEDEDIETLHYDGSNAYEDMEGVD